MTDLRQAAQAALEALEATQRGHWPDDAAEVIDDLRAALAAQPVAFDHDIGAGRYQVVKGSFWWHVRIGDSTANVGKFHTKMAAEDMALKLLTAFRDGAFMQSRAAQPVAWTDDQMNRFVWTCSAPIHDAGSIMDRLRAFREYEATRGRAIPAEQPQQDELQQAKDRIDRLETEMRKLRGNLRGVFDRELWDSLG